VSGVSGAVAPVQRFGPALNLNIHFPMLVLDGAYLVGTKAPVFRRIAPPGEAELQALVERLAEHIGGALERKMPRALFSSPPGIVLEPLDFIAPGDARTAAAHAPDEISRNVRCQRSATTSNCFSCGMLGHGYSDAGPCLGMAGSTDARLVT
jgi:hypothetical protein